MSELMPVDHNPGMRDDIPGDGKIHQVQWLQVVGGNLYGIQPSQAADVSLRVCYIPVFSNLLSIVVGQADPQAPVKMNYKPQAVQSFQVASVMNKRNPLITFQQLLDFPFPVLLCHSPHSLLQMPLFYAFWFPVISICAGFPFVEKSGIHFSQEFFISI